VRHIPSGKLERWLGGNAEHISRCMNNPAAKWYGPHIYVGSMPRGSAVYATRDGDFVGRLNGGDFVSMFEYQVDRAKQYLKRLARSQGHSLKAIADFDALIAAATTPGQRREFFWQKAGVTSVINGTTSLFGVGAHPAAGANAANAPGGAAPTGSGTTGCIPFAAPGGALTTHITGLFGTGSVGQNSMLLYDRIFHVNKTMNSTTNESVTGVPTRYQSTTAGAADSAEGNFLMIEVGGTALAATAHNWNALYRDQAGNDAQTLPQVTGNSAAIVRRLDQPLGQWFCPLGSGDTGIADLNEIDCSATVATGVINFVIGHPLGWIPLGLANALTVMDGVNSINSLVRIFDDAALALLQPLSVATTATAYNAHVIALAG